MIARPWSAFKDDLNAWALETFKRTTPDGALAHLAREVDELRDQPHDLEEYADCMMLLLNGAGLAGYSMDDLLDACQTKLTINKQRTWGPLDAEGVSQHITDPRDVTP